MTDRTYPGAMSPVVFMTKPLLQKPCLHAKVNTMTIQRLNNIEDVIYIKRKPPSKRRNVQVSQNKQIEIQPPVTGLSLVSLLDS